MLVKECQCFNQYQQQQHQHIRLQDTFLQPVLKFESMRVFTWAHGCQGLPLPPPPPAAVAATTAAQQPYSAGVRGNILFS
eukprot:765100-Amphidinium_carterae.2